MYVVVMMVTPLHSFDISSSTTYLMRAGDVCLGTPFSVSSVNVACLLCHGGVELMSSPAVLFDIWCETLSTLVANEGLILFDLLPRHPQKLQLYSSL